VGGTTWAVGPEKGFLWTDWEGGADACA